MVKNIEHCIYCFDLLTRNPNDEYFTKYETQWHTKEEATLLRTEIIFFFKNAALKTIIKHPRASTAHSLNKDGVVFIGDSQPGVHSSTVTCQTTHYIHPKDQTYMERNKPKIKSIKNESSSQVMT